MQALPEGKASTTKSKQGKSKLILMAPEAPNLKICNKMSAIETFIVTDPEVIIQVRCRWLVDHTCQQQRELPT
eukprot:2017562-Amphidinium_carterae.1